VRQVFVQEQRLKLSPQIYQSLKLMELPVLELREKIEEEIEKNPALEILEESAAFSPENYRRREEDSLFRRGQDAVPLRRSGQQASDDKRRFLEGAVARPETLQEHLLRQLALETADGEVRRIGELLIQNLDADGFHKEPVDLLLEGTDRAKAAEALSLVQSLDPCGTCTSGYEESLKVQARLLPGAPALMEAALDRLPALEKGKFAETAKELGRGEAELRACFRRITEELSPFPGRRFAAGETRYVTPDLQVIRKAGRFSIILNNEEIPVVGINPFFMKLAEQKDRANRTARDFARENIREARWFIQSINQRNHTLLRVARAIINFQRTFFEQGPAYLAPLTLRDIAVELGLHEATISRTAGGKYMQTEWGIYELRHFFSNSISGSGSSGSRYSKEGVKEVLKELLNGKTGRVTDQELSGMLARRGITLARRTVAKYRKELDVDSSYRRK
jgi:RNA polymerase sigma-54 factor